MAHAASRALNIPGKSILVASTGIIGKRLPMARIRKSIPELVKGLQPSGLADAEEGIMTTDKFPKIECRRALIAGKEVSICGLAKGAGMIEPGMATMLSFILTDAAVDRGTLRQSLIEGVAESFNAISVDGCMSTNDTVLLLAGGQAGNRILTGRSRDLPLFRGVLNDVMRTLALSIVRDGEGATKVITIRVEEARSREEARKAAFSIARSNLVKAAFYGQDPNWGRIIAAVGASGIPLAVDGVRLYFEDLLLFSKGRGVDRRDETKLAALMKKPSILVKVKLGTGRASFTAYASDLSHDYVSINAHYHT